VSPITVQAQQAAAQQTAPALFRPAPPRLPSAAEVQVAMALLPRPSTVGQHRPYVVRSVQSLDGQYASTLGHHVFEVNTAGRTFTLTGSPGGVRLSVTDEARRDRALNAAVLRQGLAADALAASADPETGELPAWTPLGAVVTSWSRKSRSNMVERLGQLDYTAWVGEDSLGMVTLTYPGPWLDCAPDGQTAKLHLQSFRRAFRDTFGYTLWALWKMEFQERGAPHFHLMMRCPALTPDHTPGYYGPVCVSCKHASCRKRRRTPEVFEQWVSRAWARIVAREHRKRLGYQLDPVHQQRHLEAGTGVDFRARMTDPKRIGIYFLKHGTKTHDGKEYQNQVPLEWSGEPGRGPGRFWGIWGVPSGAAAVEVDQDDALHARRILRHVYRASAWKAGRPRPRRILGVGGQLTGGFVLVNDGPAFIAQLARALEQRRVSKYP